jgi:hypothetical protein
MRRSILILPGLCAAPDQESLLRSQLTSLQQMAELGHVCKLRERRPDEFVEASYLGLDANGLHLQDGPLMVAALGHEPPARSVHYVATLMSLDDGQLRQHQLKLPSNVVAETMALLKRLDTSKLTILEGQERDHALVIEDGSPEGACLRPEQADGQPLVTYWPQGEDERILRRLIDDSVNLLSEQEFNIRRIDEGLQPVNILWPWGQGYSKSVPNLVLERGETATIATSSFRFAGLTKLARWKVDSAEIGRGTQTRWETIQNAFASNDLCIAETSAFADLRNAGKLDEADWLVRQWHDRLLAPMLDLALREPLRFTLLCPACTGPGLALQFESKGSAPQRPLPFDERILDDRSVPTKDLAQLVRQSLQLIPTVSTTTP